MIREIHSALEQWRSYDNKEHNKLLSVRGLKRNKKTAVGHWGHTRHDPGRMWKAGQGQSVHLPKVKQGRRTALCTNRRHINPPLQQQTQPRTQTYDSSRTSVRIIDTPGVPYRYTLENTSDSGTTVDKLRSPPWSNNPLGYPSAQRTKGTQRRRRDGAPSLETSRGGMPNSPVDKQPRQYDHMSSARSDTGKTQIQILRENTPPSHNRTRTY